MTGVVLALSAHTNYEWVTRNSVTLHQNKDQ